MIYTFLPYLLWTLIAWNQPGPVQQRNDPQPAVIGGDSIIPQQLQAQLAAHRKNTRSEKCYVHTDRTLYFPGETLWFNAYLCDAATLLPTASSQVLYVSMYAPNGNLVDSRTVYAGSGTGPGSFDFQSYWPGGIYQLKAWTNWMSNTQDTFVRSITLQKTVLPRLNMQLEFEKKAYGPGEEVVARVDFLGLNNQPLAFEKVSFTADAAGQQFTNGTAVTDATGRVYVRVKLPANLATNDGLLNIQVTYQGQPEAISRAIPVVLNQIDLQFFPEGGDAIAGFPCRMAFKAVNEFGKAADIAGDITDDKGLVVAHFSSYHNGMGAFELLPKAGTAYKATITQPFRSEKTYLLPEIQSTGTALRLQQQEGENLVFQVSSSQHQYLYLAGTAQDKVFFYKKINASQTASSVVVSVGDLPPGIARFTVFDGDRREIAERLVFVQRDKGLRVDIQTDKSNYLPREKVTMSIGVKDHKGRPVTGQFSLAVSDMTNLTYADDKQGHILAALLLEQELKGKIEEPNFYFDNREPKSAQALDYLLMTQGWRRWVWDAVVSGKKVQYRFPAEQDGFSGQIIDRLGHPFANQKIRLKPYGPTTHTDDNGMFYFKETNLKKYNALRIGRVDYQINNSDYVWATPPMIDFIPHEKNGQTWLKGKLVDPDWSVGELIGGSVKLIKGNKLVRGAVTDISGDFRLAVEPGEYTIEFSYTGYTSRMISGVNVKANGTTTIFMELNTSQRIYETVNVVSFKNDLVRADQTSGGKTLTSDQIKNLPTRSVNTIVATTAGASSIDGGAVNIKGARSNNTNYYVDGVRVGGSKDHTVALLSPTSLLCSEVQVVCYNIPIIRPDQTATGKTLNADQIWPTSFKGSSLKTPDRLKPGYQLSIANRRYHSAREFYVPRYQVADTASYYPTTLYWNPSVKTDKNGQATVSFVTSDAVTNFRATLEGISDNGLAGRGEKQFFVEKQLSAAAKFPPYIITGDTLELQLAITNKTPQPVSGTIACQVPDHFTRLGSSGEMVTVPAGTTTVFPVRFLIRRHFKADQKLVTLQFITLTSAKESCSAAVTTIEHGFPVRQVTGSNSSHTFQINLMHPIAGTVSATLTAYPSAIEEVLSGAERMLSQPSGCFEQVSSSNYPNLLVLDLLKSTGRIAPETESRARQYLAEGYRKLTGYECKTGGFDWYGTPPGHEALTAYGILEFCDMKQVFDVDQGLIDRSVAWLKTRRDGKGGWLSRDGLHSWGKSDVLSAYIAWAMSAAGYGHEIKPEIDAAARLAMASGDLYQIALMANTLLYFNDPRAGEMIQILLEKQEKDGSWMGKTQSVVYSSGPQLRIETTALATLALLKSNHPVERAIQFIAGSKNAYGYGNTQSTVLALKALVEYSKTATFNDLSGKMIVQVDGQTISNHEFTVQTKGKITIAGLEQYFTNDHPVIQVLFDREKSAIPYDLEVQYSSSMPLNTPDCPLAFAVELGDQTSQKPVHAGETVRMTATLTNISGQAFASPVMVLGIPAGLSLQPWQLKQLMERHQCDFYELRDGMAVFYFRGMAAGETRAIHLDLRVDIPGSYESPASQAFLYYSNEQRVWDRAARLTIAQ